MRAIIITSLLAFIFAGIATAADDSLDKAAKKTSDGMGNLLKGMGQEIKKTGIGNEAKKDDKKAGSGAEQPAEAFPPPGRDAHDAGAPVALNPSARNIELQQGVAQRAAQMRASLGEVDAGPREHAPGAS